MERTVFDKAGKAHLIPDLWDENRKRVSYSNSKTGYPSINLLAGDRNTDYTGYFPEILRDALKGVKGTCSGTCPGCYALKMTRIPEVMIKFALNTLEAMADPVRFFELIEQELTEAGFPPVLRIHDSGDIPNLKYLVAMEDFKARHPESRFYGYTKESETVEAYGVEKFLNTEGQTFSCSPWPGHCDPIGDMAQFCYDDGSNPELATLPHCPAVNREGKRTGVTCKQCNHCPYAKRGDRWAVYAH